MVASFYLREGNAVVHGGSIKVSCADGRNSAIVNVLHYACAYFMQEQVTMSPV